EGKVTYHDTGKPAENIKLFAASLDLRISNSDIIKSDRNGRYMITNLESGIYHVTIVQEEMFPDLTAIPVEHVAVEPGNTVQNIDLQLIKGGIITGRIYDTDTREPLPGIRVTAQTAEMNSRLTFGKALTDEKGEYRIRSAPGIVKVYPHSPFGYEYANIKADIEVIEGKTLDDVDFHFKKGLVLTGMVLSSEGNPLQGVVVSSRPFSDWRGTVISGDEGNFTLTGLKDGGMLLIDAEHKEQRLRSKADFKIHAGTEIEIHLEPYETATIEGRVVDEHDKPLSNVNIKLSKSEEDPRPASGVLSISSVIVAITDDSGNYRVDNLIPGIDRHYLSAEADGYKYESIFFLRDLKSGLQHLDDTVLEKETAERWLEGIVADSYGNPVTGARINIQGYYPLKQTYTDASGYYRFDSLKRIVERNFALDHSNYGHYRFENVATNAIRNITLVKPEYHLSGRVVDTDGEPAMGTRVSIEPQMRDSGFVYIGKQTDIDGRFCFDNMIDNRVTLSFYHHEKSLSKRLENVETNRDDLTFILEKFDRSRTDFPVWEFDQRRITILEDGNSPELNCSQWIQGEPVKIKNLLGNVVVLDFWTSGYSKSVEGLEIMKALTKEYSEKGLIIIGIHEYTKDITLLKKLLADKEISYTVAVDKQSIIEDSMGETFELYGLTRKKFPNIIIDRDGSIIRDVYERSLLVQIEMLFNNKTSSSPLPKQATGTGKTMSDDNIWHFGWNEGMAKAQREKKPVIVQFDMKKDGIWRNAINDSLYQTPDIRKRLESEWICILLDVAEQRKTATYQGRTFSYRDLLRFFRSDTSATHVFFNKTGEPVQSVLSYVLRGNKEHIDLILDYMRDELYEKDITFHEYLKEFKPL
ncbi:MAG: redoxin domain-containing protein, partial [Candidatus Latescibacteria bacterium]|nr:redoxin domain-containing protein [Candidatus Latescibacterota bacterium]